MKDYDKIREFSYVKYWDVNNLYGWTMSQKILVNIFEWIEYSSQFNKDFVKNYNEESDEGHFTEVDVQYSERLLELHNNLPFLHERMKIDKAGNFVVNLHDKTEYIIHIKKLKKELNHDLVFTKGLNLIKMLS